MNRHRVHELPTIHFVTGNKAKFREATRIAKEFGLRLSFEDLDLDEPQSDSIEYVARTTALLAFQIIKQPLFVEDAGLFIDSLHGFPGVYSSYVYSSIGVPGLLKLMSGISDRRAMFKSCVALCSSSTLSGPKLFIGEVEGSISKLARGEGGFGFDPVFVPSGISRTFAQLSIMEKNRLSHRSRAVRALCSFVLKNRRIVE